MNLSRELLSFQHVHMSFILSLGKTAYCDKLGAQGEIKVDRVVIES